MITRFKGDNGRRLLIEAFLSQKIIRDIEIAEYLTDNVELSMLEDGEHLILQDNNDNDLYFIITGAFSIIVNGREVAIRNSGLHVGEMAMIDPTVPRSASVIASGRSVVAKISEPIFSELAESYPNLWRFIALELSERLRERNKFITLPNPRPFLFLGSSTESLDMARGIQYGLMHDDLTVTVWTDNVFGASKFPIEDLEHQVRTSDFACLVIGPDDTVISRESEYKAPRDNVIFELGMFMGALTRERVFIILPDGAKLKLPTDLLGLTPIKYKMEPSSDLAIVIAPVCTELRNLIKKYGVK